MGAPTAPVMRHSSDYSNQKLPHDSSLQDRSSSANDVHTPDSPSASVHAGARMPESPSTVDLTMHKTAEVARGTKFTDQLALLLQENNAKFAQLIDGQTKLITLLIEKKEEEKKEEEKKNKIGEAWMQTWGVRHVDYFSQRTMLISAIACKLIGALGLSLIAPLALKDCFTIVREWSLAPFGKGHTFTALVGFGALFTFGWNFTKNQAITADALSAVAWWVIPATGKP